MKWPASRPPPVLGQTLQPERASGARAWPLDAQPPRNLVLAAALVAGCLVLQQCASLPALPWLALMAAGALIALGLGSGRGWLRGLACGLLGFCWAGWQAHQAVSARLGSELEGRDLVVVGSVESLPHEAPQGVRFVFRVDDCVQPAAQCPRGERVRLTWSYAFGRAPLATPDRADAPRSRLRPGDRWQLNVRLRRPLASVNPGLFDAEQRLLEEGIVALGSVRRARADMLPNLQLDSSGLSVRAAFDRARQTGLDALERALVNARADARGVLLALAFGDQSAISGRDWEMFNHTGVAHLMSISGLHITMLAAIVALATRWILRRRMVVRSGLLERMHAPALQWWAAVMTAFIYSGLAGWGLPAQRTCWMLAITAWAFCYGRQRGLFSVLALAAAVVCVLDPWAPLAAGFWLSFATVAAIALGARATSRKRTGTATEARAPLQVRAESASHAASEARPPARARRLQGLAFHAWRSIREGARSQWAATLALLPLGALFFSSASLLSPLANALAIPLVSGFVTPAVLLLAAIAQVFPAGALWVAPCVSVPVEFLLDALRTMSEWPVGVVVVAKPDGVTLVLAIVAVVMLLKPGPVAWRAVWAIGLVPLLVRGPEHVPDGGLRVSALDVGQGMAVLVETGRHRLLYDTGPGWSEDQDAGARIIVPWLRARGIGSIDKVVVSHADLDHSGGLASILRQLKVEQVLSSVPADHPLIRGLRNHYPCRRGDSWHWGRVSFTWLHPGEEFPPGAARSPTNASSCVLRIVSPSGTVLLTGDIESRQEAALVARFGRTLRADMLLVPHHGSNTSSSADFLAAVAPSYAVVQAGYRNRFGHPTEKVLSRYRLANATVLRTDWHGAIELRFNPVRQFPDIRLARYESAPYWRLQPDGAAPPALREQRAPKVSGPEADRPITVPDAY